jgi:putative transposase
MPAIHYMIAGMARSYMVSPIYRANIISLEVFAMPTYKPGHAALRKGRVSVSNGIYLVTATTINRTRAFENFHAACAAAHCFEDGRVLKNAAMLAWVLMPDHAHWLIETSKHDVLGNIFNRIKSASARQANRVLQRKGALWSAAYHDHALRAEDDLPDTARYVVANPLRAGLVKSLGDYPFWNAIWL